MKELRIVSNGENCKVSISSDILIIFETEKRKINFIKNFFVYIKDMTKTYEERFLEEYITCDENIKNMKKEIEKYDEIMNTLKQEDIKNIIDKALKDETTTLLSYLKYDGVELDKHTKKLIENISSETIYSTMNNRIDTQKRYNIPGVEDHKKLLIQIKELRLIENYYDFIDVAFKDKKCVVPMMFDLLIKAYKKTDYLMKLKDIMNKEFYIKLLNKETVLLEFFSKEPFGAYISFDPADFYQIIPESVRINNLEGVRGININGHCLYSDEEMKNIGKYIIKGHNDVYLNINIMPNKINRSIVCLAKVKY